MSKKRAADALAESTARLATVTRREARPTQEAAAEADRVLLARARAVIAGGLRATGKDGPDLEGWLAADPGEKAAVAAGAVSRAAHPSALESGSLDRITRRLGGIAERLAHAEVWEAQARVQQAAVAELAGRRAPEYGRLRLVEKEPPRALEPSREPSYRRCSCYGCRHHTGVCAGDRL
jgi:hypothetical protein